jgi:hypothetical protein
MKCYCSDHASRSSTPSTQLPLLDSKELIDREDDYAPIISLNLVNSSSIIEAYIPISSLKPSTLSQIYLSACDPVDFST